MIPPVNLRAEVALVKCARVARGVAECEDHRLTVRETPLGHTPDFIAYRARLVENVITGRVDGVLAGERLGVVVRTRLAGDEPSVPRLTVIHLRRAYLPPIARQREFGPFLYGRPGLGLQLGEGVRCDSALRVLPGVFDPADEPSGQRRFADIVAGGATEANGRDCGMAVELSGFDFRSDLLQRFGLPFVRALGMEQLAFAPRENVKHVAERIVVILRDLEGERVELCGCSAHPGITVSRRPARHLLDQLLPF